ncbi:alpha/beta fold hydrolase [Halomicroarcula sp. GCM10025324]|uniref:alpha/beta fold hydrolase n=1 Tax=Haloarcula TaxID=2237 RepID=UPI0023E7CF5F|nr:alpha/beta hydrolase [Halomicroarcula sp. ZS-22-S1]
MPTIQCNGAELYYEDHGEGDPIVFLHGATAGLRYFEPQLASLSNEYRTLAVDFRGHGRSEKTELGHTLSQYARDVHEFLRQLDLDDVVIAGWSMGAIVSWEYIDQFGTDRVRAMVDVDMEPSPMKRDDYEYGSYGRDDLEQTINQIQTDPLGLLEEQATGMLKEKPSRELRNLILDEGSQTPPAIQGTLMFGLLYLRDYRDILSTIDVPTLVCAGADEKWRSVESVEYAAEILPESSFELFEDSGHCITVEEPERFNRILSDFINSL